MQNGDRDHPLHVWVVDGSGGWRTHVAAMLHDMGFTTQTFESAAGCPSHKPEGMAAAVILFGTAGFGELERVELAALTHRGDAPVILLVYPFNVSTSLSAFRLGAADVRELLMPAARLRDTIESTIQLCATLRTRRETLLGAL